MNEHTGQTKADLCAIHEIASQRHYELKTMRKEGTLTMGLLSFLFQLCSLKLIKGAATLFIAVL